MLLWSRESSSLLSVYCLSPCSFLHRRAFAILSNKMSFVSARTCSACAIPMHGAFLWAHGTVYHLQCFRCIVSTLVLCFEHLNQLLQDCGDVVASKFFFIDGSDKQQPLCERDYFRRLDLICAKCGMALRGSYIKACSTLHVRMMMSPIHLTALQTESFMSSISHAPYVRCFSGRKTHIMSTTMTYTAITIIQRALRQNV